MNSRTSAKATASCDLGARARDFALEVSPLIAQRYPLIADARRSSPIRSCARRERSSAACATTIPPAIGRSPRWPRARKWSCVRRAANALVAIDDFIVDSYTTAVKDGEMAIEVRFPTPDAAHVAARITNSSARSAISRRHPRRAQITLGSRRNDQRRRRCDRRGGREGVARERGREIARRCRSRAKT